MSLDCQRFLALLGASVLAGAWGLAAAPPAAAHPHAWIDVTVQVLFDPSHQVTGLRETWLFDESYTAFAMQGLGRKSHGRPAQAEIDAITRENIKNLGPYAYFTKVDHRGKDVPVAAAAEVSSGLRDNRLFMTFTVPFRSPVALAGAPLDYAVFDPSYYIEMLHAESADAIALDGAPAGCGYRLFKAAPTLDTIARAASLDRTQTSDRSLGALFAERVEVRCP